MELELKQLSKLELSENQLKVIKDKYLKDSPTVEQWLRTICHNIALSEILHSGKISEQRIFEGINYKKFYNINFAARDRKNLDENGLFTAKNWKPLESGLIGTVKLIGLSSKK